MMGTASGHAAVTVGRRTVLGGLVGGGLLVSAGCSFQDTGSSEDGGGTGGGRLRIATTGITTLDPHIVGSAISVVTAGLLEGLVLQNPEATDVIPGTAESWEVSSDELIYTFALRKDAKWSNGDAISAQDVVWTFKRLLTPTGATANAATGSSSYQPGLGIKGASDFASGALEDWEEVGVKAVDESIVEITLEHRNPDFLISMTHYSMVLLHPATVEEKPQDWMQPEHFVGNAAFVPDTWVQNSTLLLRKNENYWDVDQVALDEVELRLGGDPATNVLAFKSGELDYVRVSGSVVAKDTELTDKLARVDGYLVAYLQTMWGGHPAIKDPRARQALSLAIDREALAKVGGFDQAGTSLIPSAVPGWNDELAIPYDVDRARQLLKEGGGGVKKVRIQSATEVPILEVLKEQWRENLGLELSIDVLESGVFTETRLKPHDDESEMSLYYGTYGGLPTFNTWVFINFDPNRTRQMSLSLSDWEDYQKVQADAKLDGPDKAAALNEILSTKASPEAKEFTELAMQARDMTDPDERLETFTRAGTVRRDIAQSLPLTWGPMLAAVADRVSGLNLRSSPEAFYYKDVSVSTE